MGFEFFRTAIILLDAVDINLTNRLGTRQRLGLVLLGMSEVFYVDYFFFITDVFVMHR